MREASNRRTVTGTDSYAFSFSNLTPTRGGPRKYIYMKQYKVVFEEIIDVFNSKQDYDFDSHEFIKILEMSNPRVYYKLLQKFIPSDTLDTAYQKLHANIGRFLAEEQEQFRIKKLGKHASPNYKNVESENEKWLKN